MKGQGVGPLFDTLNPVPRPEPTPGRATVQDFAR